MPGVVLKHRHLAAANSKWKVYLDHLVDDRGNEVPDYLVIEPRDVGANRVTGVCVLPMLGERFLLISSYRHALGTQLWEVPRGFLDAGESPATSALRELTEETGLSCAASDLVPLGHFAAEGSTIAGRGALFLARNCIGEPRAAEDEIGLGAMRLFERAEMDRMVADGGIEDAGTLICYYRYRALPSPTQAR